MFPTHRHRATARLRISLLLAVLSVAPGNATAQTMVPEPREAPLLGGERSELETNPDLRWRVEAADRALRNGMPLAADWYAEILARHTVPDTLRKSLQLRQVSALIGAGRFGEADSVLDAMGVPPEDAGLRAAYFLRRGVVSFRGGDMERAREALEAIEVSALSEDDLAWHAVLGGLQLEREGRFSEAIARYQEARAGALSANQRRVAESLIQRNRVLQGRRSESLVRDLQNLLDENRYSRLAAQYAQELAVSLFHLEREEEALRVLRQQIERTLPENRDQLDQLHLLGALLEREAGRTGLRHLQWLLRHGRNREFQEVAIRFLLQSAGNGVAEEVLLEFFQEVLLARQDHPLAAELYFTRGFLYQQIGRTEDAKQLFHLLLSEYPGSVYAAESLRMLGYLSWEARQFRTAADYFSRLRGNLADGRERLEAGLYQADAFFRNQDYETASRAYEAVFPELRDEVLREQVLYQWVLADVRHGNLERAGANLDRYAAPHGAARQMRWEAEWNLADALRRRTTPEEAYVRLRRLLNADFADAMPGLMRLRFLWLEALLALDSGRAEEVPAITDTILELLVAGGLPGLTESLEDEITVRSLMILSRSYLRRAAREGIAVAGSDLARSGFDVIERMENLYPEHEVTIQALFEKARFLREAGRAVDAQNIYLSIFERQAESVYAPVALYEAAINAANLIALENPDTLNVKTSEPIQLLNRLTENYQQDTQLFFFARLKQGDIARDLGQFGVAQTLYEDVVKAFPEHPQRFLPEMGRAEALLAQAGDDPSRLGEAAGSFERLFERPGTPLDLRVEAGFKWAFALAAQGNVVRAQSAHNLLQARYLHEDGHREDLGSTGRYWMARSLLASGQLYEREGFLAAARKQYQAILTYGLPGTALATANLSRLGFAPVVAEAVNP